MPRPTPRAPAQWSGRDVYLPEFLIWMAGLVPAIHAVMAARRDNARQTNIPAISFSLRQKIHF